LTKNGVIYPTKFVFNNVANTTKNKLSTQEFIRAVNKHAVVESLEATVTIVGNPLLLDSINITPKQMVENDTSLPVDWISKPVIVKLDVAFPSSKNIRSTDSSFSFRQPFWYQGEYNLLFVSNNFSSDGTFKQTLNMFAVPKNEVVANEEEKQTIEIPSPPPPIDSDLPGLPRNI
jgi:hypothetical protein